MGEENSLLFIHMSDAHCGHRFEEKTLQQPLPKAFVFINTQKGFEAAVLKKLRKIEGVDEAFVVYGVYDIIAKLKAKTINKLKETITLRIRRLDKVRSTLTMMILEQL
jgi:DNA-binding Lrp family transcriptional regulator